MRRIKNNETAVEIALQCGYHQIAELIDDSIKHHKALDILDVDMNEKDENNETAIEVAIRRGYHQIAELIKNSKKICSNNVNPKKETKIDSKNIDILSMDMDELVRMADESAKRLCRKD